MRQEYFVASGVIEKGRLKVAHKADFEQAMRRFPDGPVAVLVKVEKPQRSNAQNKFWHGVVIPAFAESCGYDFEEMKDVLALKLIPKEITDTKTGEIYKVPGHTSALNVKEFNDLIERARRFGAELGIVIPNPEEYAA